MARLKSIPRMIKRYIKRDTNSPYTARYPDGAVDRFGQQEYREWQIEALTQPFSMKDLARLPEGQQKKEWRFISVVGDTKIEVGLQVYYKERIFEIQSIQDWDQCAKGTMVRVT